MAAANQATHPLQALGEATTSLEASILLCLAKPGKRAVHDLRTSTRRVEAQLELLSMLPGLPPHERQRDEAVHLLKQIRHAAGQVRDIDVQRDLIRAEAAAGDKDPRLSAEADHLRRDLKRRRDEQAVHLLHLLHKQRAHLPLAFEELLHTLAPAGSITLSEHKLTELVRDRYGRNGERHPSAKAPQDIAELHEIRKRAKLARYLAESAPESAIAAHRLATRFETLQQAGGAWHDWLVLTEVATHELGDSAQLPPLFAAHAKSALRTFKHRLSYKI